MARRVAIVVPSIVNCGGVAAVAEFLIQLVKDHTDYDLKVISLAMGARDACSTRLSSPGTWLRGITTEQGDFRGTPYTHVGAHLSEIETQRYKHRARLAAEVEGCDLIQVVAGFPAWAWPLTGLGIPVSLQVATLVEVERAGLMVKWTGPMGAWRRRMTHGLTAMEGATLRAVDAVQVENRWMLDHVAGVTAGHDVDVRFAAPGVDAALFHPSETVPNLPGYVLSVGRMSDPRKDHMLLLAAYHQLCQGMETPPRLALAGPDGPTEAFEAEAREKGLWDRIDIHVFPSKQDLAALYRGASAFVLASKEEGFGVTVIEAMASGAPPVSTRSGGPDDIIRDGVDGYLVDPGDAAGMAERLHRIVSDPAHHAALRTEARASVEQTYSVEATGAAFLGVFARFLENPRRKGVAS